jgi:hypothetical protein
VTCVRVRQHTLSSAAHAATPARRAAWWRSLAAVEHSWWCGGCVSARLCSLAALRCAQSPTPRQRARDAGTGRPYLTLPRPHKLSHGATVPQRQATAFDFATRPAVGTQGRRRAAVLHLLLPRASPGRRARVRRRLCRLGGGGSRHAAWRQRRCALCAHRCGGSRVARRAPRGGAVTCNGAAAAAARLSGPLGSVCCGHQRSTAWRAAPRCQHASLRARWLGERPRDAR